MNPRRNTPRHIVIKLTKIKDKYKTLKAAREKRQITYKGTPNRISAHFSTENSTSQMGIFKVDEREETTTKNTLPSKTLIQT